MNSGLCTIKETFTGMTYRGYAIFISEQVDILFGEPLKDGVKSYFAVNVSSSRRPVGACVNAYSVFKLSEIKMRIDYDIDGHKYMGKVYRNTPLIKMKYVEMLKEQARQVA